MQAKLWEDQDEIRRLEERMERMYFEAQKLEEQIADRDRKYRQSDMLFHMERDRKMQKDNSKRKKIPIEKACL